jgi:hypothetical protein
MSNVGLKRGGSWACFSEICKSSTRRETLQVTSNVYGGVRLVCEVNPDEYLHKYQAVRGLLTTVIKQLTYLEEVVQATLDESMTDVDWDDMDYVDEELDRIINAANSNLHEIDVHVI